ncbi:MAG: SDR family NAD(P)-dependent oxidoreductase [Pseudomonas sp.]|uniref:SDR family NAD(P)-dependent oxidoreductase n=1 Tax=Pseudomonas sp. TaxID=306 RepID=UPI003C70FC65
MSNKTCLILGASRGLGLALAEEYCVRGYHVIATSRSDSPQLDSLKLRYPECLSLERVDIADLTSVQALQGRLATTRLNTLFINAGVCKANELTTLQVDEQDFVDMLLTNALSPVRALEVFHGNVERDGVVAVMSSELGSIADNPGVWELYSSSKAALNMLMKAFYRRHQDDSLAYLLVAPGWVRTQMGGPDALLEISESIPLVVETVEGHAGRPGLRFTDRQGMTLPW